MYCSKCGYLLDEDDVFCSQCGAKTKKAPVETDEANSEDKLEEKEVSEEEEKTVHHNEEFKWSVPEFNVEKKKEEVIFDWSEKKEAAPAPESEEDEILEEEPKEQEKASEKDVPLPPDEDFEVGGLNEMIDRPDSVSTRELEAHIFGEGRDDGMQDKYFTFTKKNEEIQKLLDEEYEKIKKNTRSIPQVELPERHDTIQIDLKEVEAEQESFTKVNVFESSDAEDENEKKVSAWTAALVMEKEKQAMSEHEENHEENQEDDADKDAVNEPENKVLGWKAALDREKSKLGVDKPAVINATSDTLHRIDAFYTDSGEEEPKKKKVGGKEIAARVIIVLLIMVIAFELVCLAAQMFWQDSTFAKAVISAQDTVVKKVVNIFKFFK